MGEKTDPRSLISIEGLPRKVESRIGRPIPDVEDICGSDFTCLGDKLTVGDVMVAMRKIVQAAKTPCDRHFNSPEWWVANVDAAADLVIDVAKAIAAPHQDDDSVDAAYYYILKGLHGFLKIPTHFSLEPYGEVRLGHLTEAIGKAKWHGLPQNELNALTARVQALNSEAQQLLGMCAFSFFPVTQWQASLISSDVENIAEGTREERHELVKILRERHEEDGAFFRLDDEVRECLGKAKERIAARTSRNDRFDSAFRNAIIELGAKPGAQIEFEHHGDLHLGAVDSFIVAASDGPVRGSIVIVISPASGESSLKNSIGIIMMGGKKRRR